MDADEARLGAQAQHILQGERPIYYTVSLTWEAGKLPCGYSICACWLFVVDMAIMP